MPGAQGSQKTVSDSLIPWNYSDGYEPLWVLGSQCMSSARTRTLHTWAISPAPRVLLLLLPTRALGDISKLLTFFPLKVKINLCTKSCHFTIEKTWLQLATGFSNMNLDMKTKLPCLKLEKLGLLKNKMKLTGVRVSGCVVKSFPTWSGIKAPGELLQTMSSAEGRGALHFRKFNSAFPVCPTHRL